MLDTIKAEHNLKRLGRARGVSGFVFLVPVVTLLYKYTGLSTMQIVLLANISTFVFAIFELPTSTLADTMGRKKSLLRSAGANICSTALIFLFPAFWSYVLASICFGFYWCFWSGTAQAFLDENLRVVLREKEFGKIIGHYNALEKGAGIIAPLVTTALLKGLGESGYFWLAGIDFLFAVVLRIFLKQLYETVHPQGFSNVYDFFYQQRNTASSALKNVWNNKILRRYTLYRALANHLSYFILLAFIMMTDAGMPDRGSGILTVGASFMMMLSSKYAYLFADKKGRGWVWVFSNIFQALLLIVVGFFTGNRIIVASIFLLFQFFEGLRMPAWNHCIVEQTQGVAIATTRSVIFAFFGLRTTVGKQVLSLFPIEYAMIGMGVFLLIVNVIFAKRIIRE